MVQRNEAGVVGFQVIDQRTEAVTQCIAALQKASQAFIHLTCIYYTFYYLPDIAPGTGE
jgi:hypothetical protein